MRPEPVESGGPTMLARHASREHRSELSVLRVRLLVCQLQSSIGIRSDDFCLHRSTYNKIEADQSILLSAGWNEEVLLTAEAVPTTEWHVLEIYRLPSTTPLDNSLGFWFSPSY